MPLERIHLDLSIIIEEETCVERPLKKPPRRPSENPFRKPLQKTPLKAPLKTPLKTPLKDPQEEFADKPWVAQALGEINYKSGTKRKS